LPAGAFVVNLQISSAHPHIPRPRRKAARMCTDAAGEVRLAHGGDECRLRGDVSTGNGDQCHHRQGWMTVIV
jgi:hypothetical protein